MALIDQFADLFDQAPPADVADAADDRMNTGAVPVADDCGICGHDHDIRNHPQHSANTQSRATAGDPQNPQVPQGGYPQTPAKGIALTDEDRQRIRTWLNLIGETDQPTINEVLDRCTSNPDCRAYYLRRSAEGTPEPEAPEHWGELRPCAWCTELMQSGQCKAAQRGELATRNYTPVVWIPRRCGSYKPRLHVVNGMPSNIKQKETK